MLKSLHIRDFAIIDELSVEFDSGLNIMTGETGAGKTIIIEALKLILGGRAQSDTIRVGKESASVTAVFDSNKITCAVKNSLKESGIDCTGDVVVTRIVHQQNKGKTTVNGVPVSGGQLKAFGEYLVDLSGQHEHQSLLEPKNHASIVDAYGGLDELAKKYLEIHSNWNNAKNELNDLQTNERTAKEKLDYLKFQLDELKSANLKFGEEEELENERKKLKFAKILEEKIRAAESVLYGSEGAAVELVDIASANIFQCAEYDKEVVKWKEQLSRARAEIEDVAREVSSYADGLDSDPDRLLEIEERLHLIRHLIKKHGGSLDLCIAKRDIIEGEFSTIINYDEILEKKRLELEKLSEARRNVAKIWSDSRKQCSKKMSKVVQSELSSLGMMKSKFSVSVEEKPESLWDAEGPDSIQFMIAPNIGEPLKPLAKIASGGELSRTMLAIKSALSGIGKTVTTSVFDEVDSGIGGAVAEVVGKKLKSVAEGRQVICITHLPQVAVFGNCHNKILKKEEKGRTIATLESLSGSLRVMEIARMLGGSKITDTTIKHAEEMLKSATLC